MGLSGGGPVCTRILQLVNKEFRLVLRVKEFRYVRTFLYGPFTLPETETKTHTDTGKMDSEANRNLCWCLAMCNKDTYS